MASRVAGKIKLQSVDELLGVPEIAGTQEIEIGRIHAFPNHPFKVLDDEKMDTLVDSIRKNGILNPVIVRPDQSGNYEMISGHRRLHAARIVGLKKIPAIVKEMSDDEAIIKMVDANIQREEILPSEKAFAYKMKLDAYILRDMRKDYNLFNSQLGILGTEKETFTKYLLKEKTISDIAEDQGITYESARQQIQKIKVRMKKQVKRFMDGQPGGIA